MVEQCRSDPLVDPAAFPQPVDPGSGQHQDLDGALVEPAQPAVDITVQGDDPEALACRQHEAFPARAVGTDHGPLRQGLQGGAAGARDQGVAGVGPFRVGSDGQARLVGDRDVLGTVDRDVDLAGPESPRDGGHEDALAGDHVDGSDVSLGDDRDQLDLVTDCAEPVGDESGLDQGQPRAAGADPDFQLRASSQARYSAVFATTTRPAASL